MTSNDLFRAVNGGVLSLTQGRAVLQMTTDNSLTSKMVPANNSASSAERIPEVADIFLIPAFQFGQVVQHRTRKPPIKVSTHGQVTK